MLLLLVQFLVCSCSSCCGTHHHRNHRHRCRQRLDHVGKGELHRRRVSHSKSLYRINRMLASGRARWLAFITNKRVSAHDGYEAIIGSNVVGLGALVAWFVYRTTTPDTQHKYNNHADKFIRPRIPLCMYAHPYRHLYIQKEQFKYYGFLTRSTPNAVNPVFCLLNFHSDSQFRWLCHWLVLVKMAVSDLNRRGTAWLGMLLSWIITQPVVNVAQRYVLSIHRYALCRLCKWFSLLCCICLASFSTRHDNWLCKMISWLSAYIRKRRLSN